MVTQTKQITSLPPQNLDAEQSVLGCILLDNEALDEIADVLHADDFYSDIHQMIYAEIMALREAGKPIDMVTLAHHLEVTKARHDKNKNLLGEIGGPQKIMELGAAVPHSGNVKFYAEIVRDKSIQRSLTRVCTEVLRDCYDGVNDTVDVLKRAEQGIFGIMEQQETGVGMSMNEIVVETLGRIQERGERQGKVCGISSGFDDLDHQTNGFQPSELVIIAARPSMGKTAFVCNVAEWVTGSCDSTTVIFSLEQSKLELAERFLCIRAKLDGHLLRKGRLSNQERERLLSASTDLSKLPLFIDDTPGRTVAQIGAICRRLKRRKNLGLVIIDYLQLIEPEDKRSNREQQIAQITRRLKGIAKENSVPVIALSQLNRGVETRDDKRPRLADLRESGAIEQDADIVMFLHRPDAYNPEDRPGLAEIIVAKHRSGPTGDVKLQWRRESMRFESYVNGSEHFA